MDILDVYKLYRVMIMSDLYNHYIEGQTIVVEFSFLGDRYSAHIVKSDTMFNHTTIKLPSFGLYILGRLFNEYGAMIELPEHEANWLLKCLVENEDVRSRIYEIDSTV